MPALLRDGFVQGRGITMPHPAIAIGVFKGSWAEDQADLASGFFRLWGTKDRTMVCQAQEKTAVCWTNTADGHVEARSVSMSLEQTMDALEEVLKAS